MHKRGVKLLDISEPFSQIQDTGLTDYKFLCFHGEPKVIEIHKGRFSGVHTLDFYDTEWKKLDITQQRPTSKTAIPVPKNLALMITYSKLLAKDIPHVRIDWYEISGRLYFGEITFYDASGFKSFDKIEYDEYLGSLLHLQ